MKKHGFCAECNVHHAFEITGAFKYSGLVCSLGVAAGLKRADAALLGIVLTLLFADRFEEWLQARCPECGIALRVLGALA